MRWVPKGPGRHSCRRGVPQARNQRRDVLQVGSKYGGMAVSDARKLEALEDEHPNLKKY
jgi:hypothetical protein